MNGDSDSAFSMEKGFSPFAEMGNSWQSKCETFWKQSRHPLPHPPPPPPPPPPAHLASSLLNSHTQGSMLLTGKTIQDHLLSNMHSLDKLEHADLGTSFLSLVSGPLLHVPCDKRHLVDPKPISATNLDSSNCRTGNCLSQGSRVSILPGVPWPCYMDCPNLTSREAFSPLTLSNSNVNCSIRNNNATPASANGSKLQKYAHITSLPKTPVESNVSAYSHDYNHSSSLLRVFCSGTSGNLLLSDTGLLGVVCACHGLFMSISKFSEHSGSCDVNPGNAVRMDSGETLAHWWKNFFSKTGIKVVEGQRGWDWPEGISVASGLRNHPIVCMSNNPVMLDQVGPFKASASYKQQNHGEIYLKENQCHKNIVDEYPYHERDRTSQESSNSLLKYFMNSSHGSMQHAAGQHIRGLPNSFSAHTEKASHSTTDKLGSVCTSANSFPALPKIQGVGVGVGTETSFVIKRQGVSSNFELRLGQPPERIQTLDTKDQPFYGSILNGMHAEASEVCFTDKLLQKRSNELQGSGSTLQYADITSNLTERRVSTLLEHSCNVGGAYGAKTDSQKDLLNASLEMNDVNSLLLPCFRNPGTKLQFSNVNDNCSDSHVCKKLQHDYHSSESEKVSLPWSSVAAKVKEFGTNVSNAYINVNKGKKVECTMNGLLGPPKSNIAYSKGFKEDQSSFNLVLGDTLSNYSPAFHEKGLNSQQMSAMIADESYGRDILNNGPKIPSLSDIMHFNHDHIKPIQNSIVSKATAPLGFSSKTSAFALNVTPTLPKERPSGIKNGLQYENVEMPVVWKMLSDGNNGSASVRSLQEREITKNHCPQSLLTVAPSILKGHKSLLDSLRMPKNPEIGEKPMLPGKCWMGHNNERFCTVAGRSLYTEDPNLTPVEQLFVRSRGTECNFTQSDKEHCFQGSTYPYVSEKCSTAAQENYLAANYDLNDDNCFNLVKNGGATSPLQSKLNENCIFPTETAKSFDKTESLVAANIKSAESRAFQWRDVPKKIMESSSSTRKEQQASSFNQSLGNRAADVAKGFAGFARNVVPLKEQDISNLSSVCSALDVPQSSIEVNKNDSSTIEGANIRYPNNLVLDEVSGNDRSWSTDDALENEFHAEFFGSGSMVNLIKREPSKVVPRKQSLCLIEEIRLQNSLQTKNLPHNINISSTIGEESDTSQEFELEPKKRRKIVKWMKLDVPVSVSGQSSINDESPKCTEEVGQNVHSFWEVQRSVRCDQGRPNNCPYFTEQSGKQRNSAFSAVKGTSQRKNLLNFYHQYEQQTTKAHTSSLTEDTFRESAGCKKKRLLLDDASALCKEIQEICCNSAELTAKSLGGHNNSPSKPNFYKGMVRPTVFGRYGIISNGNPSKPAKIVLLREIHRNSDKSNRNADDSGKLKPRAAKVKKANVRHVMETALGKRILRSQVKKGRPHIELKCCDRNWDLETASCSATSGSYDTSYTKQKCDDHSIVERKPRVQPKAKFKECRKRSLHELLIKARRCCGELREKAVDDRTQTNEMNNGTRCSEKHLSENADMFRCATRGSDKDEYNQLLQCSRFLIKQMNTDSNGILQLEAISPHNDSKSLQPGGKFSTCARTEGYKGRKREGFLHNHPQDTDRNGGCLVPQEQLNAWLHIHRQKPQGKGRPKLSCSIVESDCRKAYARYKHSKSWKNLVVYKSGIHALGLYTSQFISRGAMVVEYVGEIVGLRVADRREGEYHSGKKIQHKSACYFFRIDKEHIIDATRKGGIARFVNHSCQPNCVAKVISVRTEKKVVFFAERDIYPGEEITYDYHFNHEDEGEKIPCLCKSKNCRRYLN